MSTYIEIPEANQQNIPIFSEEPNDDLIKEIKQHIRETASPHTWRGHSHTEPEEDAFILYVDEFDIPASKDVLRIAPCPCCSPNHAKYKNNGKIAWFPHEAVIRLIGPDCFAAINSGRHEAAVIELRKKQKRRTELAAIALHGPCLGDLIDVITEAFPIAESLDNFMSEINRVLYNELQLQLWREVKEGNLTIIETRRVSFQKRDGTSGERMEEFRSSFGKIAGHTMLDRSVHHAANKLKTLMSGLKRYKALLNEEGTPDTLDDDTRKLIAEVLPKGRNEAIKILTGMADRQLFLTTDAIKILNQWGQHPNAPMRLSIERKGTEVIMSLKGKSWLMSTARRVSIKKNVTKTIPKVSGLTT